MSTLRKIKKSEGIRVSAPKAAGAMSVHSFLSRLRAAGRKKITILLIPHTERRVLNVQLSFFALSGILLGAGLVFIAFVFSAARFSDTVNKLESRSSDLATTQGQLDAIRDQTGQLMTAAKRFESALSKTRDRVGIRAADPNSPAQSGDLASVSETDTAGEGSVREISELRRVTEYLESSVDPLKTIGSLLQNQSAVLTEIPNIWPVKGTSHISTFYGQNEDPFTGQWHIYKGVDISTYRTGDPVVSTADGRVVTTGFDPNMGNFIVIQHSHGFNTRYGHLMAFRVAKGQKIKQGQVIGLLGNTGLTTGPYLHYEVHLGTGVIDPLKFLNIRAAAMAAE